VAVVGAAAVQELLPLRPLPRRSAHLPDRGQMAAAEPADLTLHPTLLMRPSTPGV
jgi:hypothetical protein